MALRQLLNIIHISSPEVANAQIILFFSLCFIFLACVTTAMRFYVNFCRENLTFTIVSDFSIRIFSNNINKEYIDHVRNDTAELFSGLDKIQYLSYGAIGPLNQAVVFCINAFIILLYIIFISPVFSLILIIAIFLLFLISNRLIVNRRRLGASRISVLSNKRMRAVHEAINGFREISLLGMQAEAQRDFANAETDFRSVQAQIGYSSGIPRTIVELIYLIAFLGIVVLWSISPHGFSAMIPLGGALVLSVQRMLPMVNGAVSGWLLFFSNLTLVKDILALVNQVPLAIPQASAKALNFGSKISIENITMSYPERGQVLNGVTLTISKGERIGIVGETGGGKSTLLDCIAGLLTPDSGLIHVDDTLLVRENRAAWWQIMSFVSQSVYLPDYSICQLISGRTEPNSSEIAQIWESLQIAKIDEFVRSLDAGLSTNIGDNAIKLSGGQMQRIALARALYRKPALLILDESTNQLDPATKSSVLASVGSLDKQMTMIIVAHNIEDLKICNHIFSLKEGKLTELSGVPTT